MSLRRTLTSLALLSALLLPLQVHADEEGAALQVAEAVIATSVENLTPIGVADTFPAGVGKLYAFTRITGATGETSIRHLWFYGDRLMAEVSLPVRSANWRTYSSKRILPAWTGQWSVDITTEEGLLIETIYFTIEDGNSY